MYMIFLIIEVAFIYYRKCEEYRIKERKIKALLFPLFSMATIHLFKIPFQYFPHYFQ